MIKEVVEIRLLKDLRTNYCDCGELSVKKGEIYLVEIDGCCDIGSSVSTARVLEDYEIKEHIGRVIRKASEEDLKKQEANKEKEIQAKKLFIEQVEAHNLKMKLVDVHLSNDRKKYTFYFSAEERIDFRQLVKDLHTPLSARIELYQIGIKDEVKFFGGCFSWCGRELCCSTFLKEFKPFSAKTAREQNISLSFGKAIGVCGRFMCCLGFEEEIYKEFRKKAPKEGSVYKTNEGVGIVEIVEPIRSCIKVRLEDKRLIEVPIK